MTGEEEEAEMEEQEVKEEEEEERREKRDRGTGTRVGGGGAANPTCAAVHAVGPATVARYITVGIEEGRKVRRLAQGLSSAGAPPGRIKGPLIQYVHKLCIHKCPPQTGMQVHCNQNAL